MSGLPAERMANMRRIILKVIVEVILAIIKMILEQFCRYVDEAEGV